MELPAFGPADLDHGEDGHHEGRVRLDCSETTLVLRTGPEADELAAELTRVLSSSSYGLGLYLDQVETERLWHVLIRQLRDGDAGLKSATLELVSTLISSRTPVAGLSCSASLLPSNPWVSNV